MKLGQIRASGNKRMNRSPLDLAAVTVLQPIAFYLVPTIAAGITGTSHPQSAAGATQRAHRWRMNATASVTHAQPSK